VPGAVERADDDGPEQRDRPHAAQDAHIHRGGATGAEQRVPHQQLVRHRHAGEGDDERVEGAFHAHVAPGLRADQREGRDDETGIDRDVPDVRDEPGPGGVREDHIAQVPGDLAGAPHRAAGRHPGEAQPLGGLGQPAPYQERGAGGEARGPGPPEVRDRGARLAAVSRERMGEHDEAEGGQGQDGEAGAGTRWENRDV
jgi:hypothetical protein